MARISFVASPNEDRGTSVSSWITSQSSGGIVNLIDSLLNNYTTWSIGSGIKDTYSYYLKKINNNETCQNDGSQTYDFLSVLRFESFSIQDVSDWNTYYAGKQLEVIIYGAIPWNNGFTTVPIFWFLGVLPTITTNDTNYFSVVSTKCLWEKLQPLALGNLTFNYSQMQSTVMCEGCEFVEVPGNTYFGRFCLTNATPPEPQCDDLRTSVPPHTLRFTITNGILSVTKDLDCYCIAQDNVFPFDSTVFTSQEIQDIFNMFMNYLSNPIRCACRFISGVVRSNCSVKFNVAVTGFKAYCGEVGGIFGIGYDNLTPTTKQLFDASFVECLDKPVSYTENLSSYCEGLVNSGEGWVLFFDPLNITVSNLECETDVCCDDVDDDEIDQIEAPQIDTIGGFSSGGGGSDVDISCICDGLTALNTMLSTKLDNIVDGQGAIADAIENLDVSVDNECVCDNLSSINDTLETINDTISDKEMTNTVTVEPSTVDNINQITVTPCQPIVTNPVNNITVTPSTVDNINQITVTPCQPIVTNPVNNITVEPCSPTINVEPSTCDIDLSNLESILEDSLNHDNKSISAILDNSLNMVNPCDDNETLSIVQALFKVSDDGENCTIKSISEILDEKFLEPQIDIVLDNQLVGHIYKQNYDYRNY